jgi:hypothetical protein
MNNRPGFCRACGCETANAWRCDSCMEKQRVSRRKRYVRKKYAGLCARCDAKAERPSIYCQEHLDMHTLSARMFRNRIPDTHCKKCGRVKDIDADAGYKLCINCREGHIGGRQAI